MRNIFISYASYHITMSFMASDNTLTISLFLWVGSLGQRSRSSAQVSQGYGHGVGGELAFWSLAFSSQLTGWWQNSCPCGCMTEALLSC